MTRIKTLDMRLLDEVFEMTDGYVLNLNDRTFAEFFGGEPSVDIEDRKYYANGSSKAKRLRTHLQTDPAPVVARTLRALWDYRDAIRGPFDDQDAKVQARRGTRRAASRPVARPRPNASVMTARRGFAPLPTLRGQGPLRCLPLEPDCAGNARARTPLTWTGS